MTFRSKMQELKWVLLRLDEWFLTGNDLAAVADGLKPATDIVRIDSKKYEMVRGSLDMTMRHLWDIAEKEQDAESILIEAYRFRVLLKEIEGLSAAKAVVRLCKMGYKANLRFDAEEDPALEIMLGLLYGFERCCIRFYAEQGYFYHRVKPGWQAKDNFHGYIRCPSCRQNDVRPSWYRDDKKYRRYWWQLYLGLA
ncbi:MAG: hypothetical protein UT82_C0014G0045 [Parcubacteria group bacterium GW2011_GWB1_40_14]|nr:MAG: hypothetical protein UT82_C0014G0045 [Parcubacteria group bacterium GW2011_GWB1_40_14]